MPAKLPGQPSHTFEINKKYFKKIRKIDSKLKFFGKGKIFEGSKQNFNLRFKRINTSTAKLILGDTYAGTV